MILELRLLAATEAKAGEAKAENRTANRLGDGRKDLGPGQRDRDRQAVSTHVI